MNRLFLPLLIVIISVAAISCSHKLAPEGHYQGTPVVADGSTDDWTLPLRFSNEKYTYQYNVTNDNKNIYICILSKDYTTQTRMLKAGMTIYFDPKGEKNKNINIAFPLRKPDDRSSNYNNRNGNPITNTDMKSELSTLLIQSDYYSTTGFVNIENGQFGVTNQKNAIQVAIKLNNDSSLVLEAIVPIKNISAELINPKKNFSVCIALNSVAGEPGNNNSPRPSYGGMHMRGMYGGGGGGRGGNSQRSAGAKEEDTWYQFRLVSK